MSIFWALYAFFFAVPFPMILYYSINYAGGERHVGSLSTPYWALAYLALSLISWCWLFGQLFIKWIFQPLKEEKALKRLLKEGTLREAEVIASKKTGRMVKGNPEMEITICFDNFSQTPIRETVSIVDMRPTLRRFDVGKSMRLRISDNLTTKPILAIEGSEVEKDKQRIIAILGWLLLIVLVIGYYVLSYHYEHQGTGWRFLTFFHPLLICPLILWGVKWLFSGALGNLFLGTRDALKLKYKGHRTEARLLGANQTGTYINEQPQIRFDLEYEDVKGVTHRASFKKVVSLLDMDITKATIIPIFYLEHQPQEVAFADDLDGI